MDHNKAACNNKKYGLSALDVWAIAFGGVVGWGAFIMPGTMFLKQAGPFGALIAIEIASFIMLVISCNYYHMLRRIPSEAGPYAWAKTAFGDNHAFLCAWFLSLAYLSIVPQNATALTHLMRILFRSTFQTGFHYRIAGYDVYSSEIVIADIALIIGALLCLGRVKISACFQTLFALALGVGILASLGGAVSSPRVSAANFNPLFYQGENGEGGFLNVISGIFSIVAVAPWLFIGFDTVPHLVNEFAFNKNSNKTKIIMDMAILCGALAYGLLIIMAASILPDWYSSWVEYVNDIPYLHRIIAIPTFYAAWEIMGNAGLALLGTAAVMAIFTGILGFYIVTGRLLRALADEGALPSWFGKVNKYGSPYNSIIFIMLASMLAPFFGRAVLGWVVDMSSIGAAIAYGYTSLASRKFALQSPKGSASSLPPLIGEVAEGRRGVTAQNSKSDIIFGTLGFLFIIIFIFLLLVPVPGLNCSLSMESYICLIIWGVLGLIFFKFMRKNMKKQ